MAATYTAAQIRDKIDDAIAAIVDGKSASRTMLGRTWTALNLDGLMKLREKYARLARSGTSRTNLIRPAEDV